MKEKYVQESGSQFDEASDIALRFRVLAGEIYNAEVNMEWIKKQMFMITATGESLDLFASQRGLSRKQAMKAQGEITFYISQPIDHTIVIPRGAVVATMDEEPLRFVTTEDEELVAGNTLVSVYAEAEKPGSNSNVEIGRVVVNVSVPAEIETVLNRMPFVDGTDEETDDELRERIRESYLNLANGTNAAYYEQLALSIQGVTKAKAVGRARGLGTVNVYVCGDGNTISDTRVAQVQSLLSEERELNVDVLAVAVNKIPYNLDVTVYKKSGYTDAEVIQLCTEAFTDYIHSIDLGGKLYLSGLGKYLLDSVCIENYEFNTTMESKEIAKSQCFSVGTVNIEVL